MTVSPELLQQAAAEQQTPDDAGLAAVADLVQQQVSAEDDVAELESQLKDANGRLRRISEVDLPAAMAEHNLKGWKAADGSAVEIKDIVRASIPKANRAAAFVWLQSHGYADLIKNTLTATFGRGEGKAADFAMRTMTEHGWEPEQTRSVHTGTLSAQVRDWVEEGKPFPADLLGVFQGQKTKITRKK